MNRLREALGDTAARPKYVETLPRHGYRFMGQLRDIASAVPRLVALPFANGTSDLHLEYLGDSLTEEFIGQLAILGGHHLPVIARTSSMHYKGTRKSAATIARELRAGYLLEGSVRCSGATLRVSAQLIEAAGQGHVWANAFEGGIGDIGCLAEPLAVAVVREIQARDSGASNQDSMRAVDDSWE